MKRYQGDPYWLTLKFSGTCRHCGRQIKRGEQAFRYKTGDLFCTKEGCGPAEQAKFESAAQDEAFMTWHTGA